MPASLPHPLIKAGSRAHPKSTRAIPVPAEMRAEDALRFRCPACATPIRARLEAAGKRGRCPACLGALVFPQPGAALAPQHLAAPKPRTGRPPSSRVPWRLPAILFAGVALGIAGGRWTGRTPAGLQDAALPLHVNHPAQVKTEAAREISRSHEAEREELPAIKPLERDPLPEENPFLRTSAPGSDGSPEPQAERALAEPAAPAPAPAQARHEPDLSEPSERPPALTAPRPKPPGAGETPRRSNEVSSLPGPPPAAALHDQEEPKANVPSGAACTAIAEAANDSATVSFPPQAEIPPASLSSNAPPKPFQAHAPRPAPQSASAEPPLEPSESRPAAMPLDPAAPGASQLPQERTPPEAAMPARPDATLPAPAAEPDSNNIDSRPPGASGEGPQGTAAASEASAAPRTARDVQKMLNERYRGKDSKMLVSTLLIDRNGDRRIHDFVRYRRKENNLSKTLLCFLAPADVRKTSTLTIERSGEDDYQRLYLPALKKNRIISAPEMGKSWMGTDFSFEDLREKKIDHFEYSRLETGFFEGLECWYFEMSPKLPHYSSYARLETWVRKDLGELARRRYYNRKGECIKELIPRHYKKFEHPTLERPVWLSTYMEMTSLRDRHQSVFVIEWAVFNINVRNETFSTRGMENPVLDFNAEERRRLLKGEESNWRP